MLTRPFGQRTRKYVFPIIHDALSKFSCFKALDRESGELRRRFEELFQLFDKFALPFLPLRIRADVLWIEGTLYEKFYHIVRWHIIKENFPFGKRLFIHDILLVGICEKPPMDTIREDAKFDVGIFREIVSQLLMITTESLSGVFGFDEKDERVIIAESPVNWL